MNVAETILEQLGGTSALLAMVGANGFVGDEHGVQFAFRGSRKANKVRIILTEDDLYTVEFWRIRGLDYVQVYEQDGLYADTLRSIFERETGLRLSL
jgi:hypothetical protein